MLRNFIGLIFGRIFEGAVHILGCDFALGKGNIYPPLNFHPAATGAGSGFQMQGKTGGGLVAECRMRPFSVIVLHPCCDQIPGMAEGRPHRDDARVQAIVSALPPYVESRYEPAGLKRLQVVKLALGVQFIAASSLRRLTGADLALQMESDEWPGSRQPFAL